jgi:hypothetical protein
MIHTARPFLLTQLRRALDVRAGEVRFISGQQPSLRVGDSLRPGEGVATRAELVEALHEVCLAEAGRSDLRGQTQATYQVHFPGLPELHCQFKVEGNTRSLTLLSEPGAAGAVAHRPRDAPPTLSAAADVDPEE